MSEGLRGNDSSECGQGPLAALEGSRDELTAVAIGLNAMATLDACLRAIRRACEPLGGARLIYVDGGSKDDSVRIAEGMGVEVIRLDTTKPTAAKGRNAGWRAAATPLVHFVDSDTVLEPDWLLRGIGEIQKDPKIASLFGQLIEANPTGSIYNRICGFDWYIPPGDWRMCGGNALFRRAALVEADGFDEALRAGEEPDLCWRLRQRGWRIVCADALMARHDLGMAGFSDYWRRAIRSGYAYAEIGLRFARTSDRLWFPEFAKNLSTLPVGLTLALGAVLLGGLRATAVLAVLVAGALSWKTFKLRRRIQPLQIRLLYVIHLAFTKIPLFFGTLRFLLERWLRRSRRDSGPAPGGEGANRPR